jgi:hypothetical protein
MPAVHPAFLFASRPWKRTNFPRVPVNICEHPQCPARATDPRKREKGG